MRDDPELEGHSKLTSSRSEFLRSVDSPSIANAIEHINERDRTEGYLGGSIRCLFPDLGIMLGHAVTVTMTSRRGPVASRAGYWRMWEAVESAPTPNILVVQDISDEPARCSYVGEVMATLALRLGCIGLVTDGGVRDLAEVERLGFHLFSAHIVVSHGNFEIVETGIPVTLAGQVVRQGDILHGDRNGIVLIPPESLDALPAAVEGVRHREAELLAYVRSPSFTLAEARSRAGY